MKFIYAEYNMYHNSIDICIYAGYLLRIDCEKAEEGLKTTPNSECAINALAPTSSVSNTTIPYITGFPSSSIYSSPEYCPASPCDVLKDFDFILTLLLFFAKR